MRPDKLHGLILPTLILLSFFISAVCHAQNSEPSVAVDFSVLNNMDPSQGVTPAAPPPKLTPPVTPSYPSRARPTDESLGRVIQPHTVSRPPAEDTQAYHHTYQPGARDIISFPVTVKDRTDQFDPAFDVTPPAKRDERTPKKTYNAALPNFEPMAVAVRPMKEPPLPPRRPPIQNASSDFVERARKIAVSNTGSDLSKGGMAMPAVPAGRVMAEPLKSLSSKDELAGNLLVPDRAALARTIEAVTAKQQGLRINVPEPASTPSPLMARIPAQPRVPVPAAKPEELEEKATAKAEMINVSKIEPAAGFQTAAVTGAGEIPRTPPEEDHEQEFISVTYAPGLTEPDQKAVGALEDKIIPLMKDNPQWQLQIQSFAGKTGQDSGSARRLSLARAMALRDRLTAQGIEAQRLDVRAMGMETDRNPVDRVDFVFFDPDLH